MTGLPDEREKRLVELRREVTRRGYDRHASALESISELPLELQSPAVAALAGRATMQKIILFPAQIQRGWDYVPKQALLFTTVGVIHLLASIWPGQAPGITELQSSGVMYTRVTLQLLYGFLEIVARGPDKPAHLRMEFSTVDWYLLALPLRQFLLANRNTADTPENKSPGAHAEALDSLPLKFSNGMKIYGLLPGEAVEAVTFQAGTWKRWFYFFRRPDSASILVALSSHYLVIIEEELNVKQGWIISYIPRSSIAGIENNPCGAWNELSIRLQQGNQSVEYPFRLQNEAVTAWHKGWVEHGGRWEDLTEPQPSP